MDALAEHIVSRLFTYEDKRLTIALNRDGFLSRPDVQEALHYASVSIYHGKAIDLRVMVETELEETPGRVLFVQDEEFNVLPDIAQRADMVTFLAKNLFPRYHWETIRHCDYYSLKWIFSHKQIVNLSREQTEKVLQEYDNSQARVNDELSRILQQWQAIIAKIEFHRPQKWASELAKLMLHAIEIDRWHAMIEPITSLNKQFQDFLRQSYVSISSASLGRNCPRNVCQVLPFIAKQENAKSALIVVDGMNLWQAEVLRSHFAANIRNIDTQFDASFSWLPSTTELSRQAIFRGDRPMESYNQSPHYEEKLWDEFWLSKKVIASQTYYQYDGDIGEVPPMRKYIGYVTIDLDEKMHAATNFMYLYDDTRRWANDGRLLENVKSLLKAGFTVYITTDHGNIEPQSEVKLAQHEKIGANWSGRHITLHPSANRETFARDHAGHVEQIDPLSQTFYPTDREVFSRENHVTHGGTHWLEVIIPFITIRNL